MKKRFKVSRLVTAEEYGYVAADNAAHAARLADDETSDIEWYRGKVSEIELRDAYPVDKQGRQVNE